MVSGRKPEETQPRLFNPASLWERQRGEGAISKGGVKKKGVIPKSWHRKRGTEEKGNWKDRRPRQESGKRGKALSSNRERIPQSMRGGKRGSSKKGKPL